MRALNRFRFPLLALGLAFTFGCSTDSPSSPTAPPTNPVPPSVGINVSVTSSTGTLEAGSTAFATLVVRATRADNGQAVANLTPGTITTTLGNFGSADGPQTLAIELVNGQATVVFFPGATVGSASIRASVSSGVGFTAIGIRERGLPDTFFLASVSPSTGSPQGGDTVTINGGGFSDPIRVTFDGIPAVVLSATATQIRVTTPRCGANGCFEAGAITPVTVSVTINLNEEGQASDSLASGFSYVNGGGGGGTLQPSIFSVTPSSGPNEGGTQVTINGDGFEAPVAVDFGNTVFVSAQVLSVTRTRIVVSSPPATAFGQGNLNQPVGIRVTNQSSGRSDLAAAAFRYGVSVLITSISPGQGTIYGGDLVTIFGQGFDSPVAVDFGGVAQQPISVSGTEVVVRTTHPSTCPGALVVHLVNIESGNGSSQAPSFLYLKPNIFSLSPSGGSQAGGTALTIGGANFGLPIIVDFSANGTSRAGTVTNATGSTINVSTPSMPDSAFDEIDCNDNADTQVGKRFIPTGADVKITDPISGCTDTFEGEFLYTPSNSTCRDDIAAPP